MAKTLKKWLAMCLTVCMCMSMFTMQASAEETEPEPAEETNTSQVWDETTQTLTLNGAAITETVALPDGATIVVNGDCSIAGGEATAITCDGALTITGSGNLILTGLHGIKATSVSIEGIDVDIDVTSAGIYATNTEGDATVTLTEVDGSIVGDYAGIYIYGNTVGSNASVTVDGCDLVLKSESTKGHGSLTQYSGICVCTNGTKFVECSVDIKNSTLNASGRDAGVAVSNRTSGADNSGSSLINITNSTVVAEGNNGVWSGIFASVNGESEDADSFITITNSSVYSASINTGVMTSSQKGESGIFLDNSILGAGGNTALRMIEETAQKQSAELKNGSTYVQLTPAAVNAGTIDVFEGKTIIATAGDGITYDAENNYFVIPRGSAVTETYTDGTVKEYTFNGQAGGVGGSGHAKEEVWGYDIPETDWDSDTIIIYTPEELVEFATKTQNGELGDCAGKTVMLGADIDMKNYDWYYRNAEGTIVTDHRIPEFSGIFDGQGYTIKNMKYLDEYKEATEPMPLAFILTANGTFKDITIDGITVNTVAPARFGGLADALSYSGDGYTEGCTVKNILVNADAQLAFGGFAFKILDIAYIKDCHVDGFTVNANGVLNGPNSGRCGGFFATGGEVTPFADCSVSNFVVNAKSTGTYLGGFVGGASMSASYTNCDIKGFELNAEAKFSAVGGFAGYTAGSAWGAGLKFENCDVTGLDIETSNVISAGTGGFIGNLFGQGKSITDGAHHFLNCTTEGTISGDTYAGGFAGWLYGRSNGCVANFGNCSAAVNIFNNDYYGAGFVGNYTPSGSNLMTAVYNNCTASGDIFGKEPVGSFLDADETTVDGIVGGTYNYDPENVDETTGETNNVAPGYRALDNGDGTWTVFPDNGKEVVTVAFHRWNDTLNDGAGDYENWRTVEVFKDVDFFEADYDNELNYSHPSYRFANGIDELNEEADDKTVQKFSYWTDKPFGTELVLDNEIEVTSAMNVYAAYTVVKTYTVTFDSNGGSSVSSVEVEEGQTVNKPANPTRSGYIFDGWELNGTAFDFSTPIMSNITLVADWDRRSTGGGGGGGSNSTLKEIEEEEVPLAGGPLWLNTTDHYAYLAGFGDGTLRPYDGITRGQVATIFFRLLTDEARAEFWSETNDFTDCGEDLWCNTAISTLSSMGIIDGYQDGTFRPNAKVTRAQFAKIMVGFFGVDQIEYAGLFTDVAEDAWHSQYVETASRLSLIQGYNDGTFKPNANITRAQACVIVNRALVRIPDEEHLLPLDEMLTWTDNTPDDWFYADMMEATNSHDYMWLNTETDIVEQWTEKLSQPDWAALEKSWSETYSD